MKVFVDECVNFKLMRYLTGHTFVHVREVEKPVIRFTATPVQ